MQIRKVVSEKSYKRQETQEQTSASKHTPNPHRDPDETHMKWPGDHMSTDAKRDTAHRDLCYASNVANHSPTHTFLEVANTTRNYAHQDITSRSNYYMNN